MPRARHALSLLAARLLHWIVVPQLRARVLGLLGATIGRNVRIADVDFFNLESGFRNLVVEDDVHIGPGCRLDLSDRVVVRRGAVLAPECLVLTHIDVGEHHGSPMTAHFPRQQGPVDIGPYSWLGARCIVLAGVTLGEQTAAAAGSLIRSDSPGGMLLAGSPAHPIRALGSRS